MRHYDPWIFAMLWESEHRKQLDRLEKARLVRLATARQASGLSRAGRQRSWSDLGSLISSLTSGARLWLRRQAAKAS